MEMVPEEEHEDDLNHQICNNWAIKSKQTRMFVS
jgi:hypothetical protein